MTTSTTSQDVIPALNAELVRIGAADEDGNGLTAQPTQDFTVIGILDSQETELIEIHEAINWLERLKCLPSNDYDAENDGFEPAWQELHKVHICR